MRVLLDTNIVIHREANRIVNENIGQLFFWLDKLKYEKCIHNETVLEIKKYKGEEERKVMLIKIQSYSLLELTSPLHQNIVVVAKKYDSTSNDAVDTKILNELFLNRVDLLISEDKKIYRKAVELGIGEKVKTINAFLEWIFLENPALQDYKVKNIRIEKFGNIDIKQPFFYTFKDNYPEFETWYMQNFDNEVYICGENDGITAFLFLKKEDTGTEDYSDIQPTFLPKKRMKIRTFKVIANGYKIGERFIKIIFDNALKNHVEEIYVTIFEDEDKQELIQLIQKFGFVKWGKKHHKNGKEESVFVRTLERTVNRENPMLTYPFCSKDAQAYWVTINPAYHTQLLPDSILKTENPDFYKENKPYSNAIKKQFVTRAYSAEPKIGDLLLFYRSGGMYKGKITTLGVVTEYKKHFRTIAEFYAYCSRRSVLTQKELSEVWHKNLYSMPKVLDFLYIDTLSKGLILKDAVDIGFDAELLKQGIVKLEKSLFNAIIEKAGLDSNRLI